MGRQRAERFACGILGVARCPKGIKVNTSVLVETLQAQEHGLLRFLSKRLGCKDAARDVLQMVSEQLLNTQHSNIVENPKAYIYRAASNMANSYDRATLARRTYEAQSATSAVLDSDTGPEDTAAAHDLLRVVEAALDELPVLTQRMFLAFRIDGMRQKDIAAKFGVSLSTVEKRIAAATLHCHRRLRSDERPAPSVPDSDKSGQG